MTEVNGLAARVDACFVVATLKTLLRFETQNPPGNVEPAVLALRDLLAAAGVEARPSLQIKRPQGRCGKLVPLGASLLTSAFSSRALR
jgi:hypothetical protein